MVARKKKETAPVVVEITIHYGVTIRDERERQGLSQKKASELAGISRRHLASLEQGANVSIDILKAVTRVLGITDLNLGDGLTIHNRAGSIAPASLLPFADGIEGEAAHLMRVARNLRDFAKSGKVGVGKSVRNDTPVGEAVNEEAGRLVELALEFARNAKKLTDKKKIHGLERDVSELLDRSNTA